MAFDVRNIVPADALSKVKALHPVQFRASEDHAAAPGLIAQETASVIPEVVAGGGTTFATVDYAKLVPVLNRCNTRPQCSS